MSNSEEDGLFSPLDLSTPVIIETLHKVIPPPPITISTQDAIAVMTAEISKGGSAPAFKPKRTEQDAWDIIQEYAAEGGILDLAEDVAQSALVLQAIYKNMQDDENSLGLSGKESMDLLLKATAQRARIKHTHQEMQIKRREVLTLDKFHAFLSQLLEILSEYIPDPNEFQQMGQQIADLCHILEDD